MKFLKRSFALLCIVLIAFTMASGTIALGGEQVYLGGSPFGVRFFTGKLTVSGFGEVDSAKGTVYPARDAGFMENDIISQVNNQNVEKVEDITSQVKKSNGEKISFTVERDGKNLNIAVIPSLSKSTGEYKIGLWLKDGTAGIGTLTYVVPETGEFGGLGHGICDAKTGKLTKIHGGYVSKVTISGVTKGASGTPGELQGIFDTEKCGKVVANTQKGVFGYLSEANKFLTDKNLIRLGSKADLHTGDAEIYCTVEGETPKKYKIKIVADTTQTDPKDSFIIEITDPALLEKTGGIVQGMSGSPVIQNGLLVGAVTHVLISDPTRGYGIFIEEMTSVSP